jgi:hypothetical protein
LELDVRLYQLTITLARNLHAARRVVACEEDDPMRRPRASLVLSLAVLAGGGTAVRAASGTVDRELHESFDVQHGDRLVLRHEDGDVRISPWDRDVLDVHVVYRADYSEGGLGVSSERDFTVDFERRGRDVRATGRELGGGGVRIGWSTMKVHEHLYTVRAPAWLELELRGEDGDVEVANWSGSTDARLEDGDLTVDGFTGTLEAVLEDGDLTLSDCRLQGARFELEDGDVDLARVGGDFRLATIDGDISARALSPRRVSIQSEDGDVDLQILPVETLDLEVRTADGDARLELGAGISAHFEVATADGAVRVDLPPGAELSEHAHGAAGSLGGGAGRILVRTEDGAVSLRGGR